MRTARSRTSGENRFDVFFVMAPPSQAVEPPANPARFIRRAKIIEPEASSGAGLSLLVSPGDRRTLGSRVAEGALRDIARATIENAYGEWGEHVRRRFEGAPLDRMFAKWVGECRWLRDTSAREVRELGS